MVCISILFCAGLLSYKITNSYALFSDSVVGEKTIGVIVNTCSMTKPNEPKLSSNMIPVYYDEKAEVWRKADSTNKSNTYKWYDYCEKMWANSVTVSETNRSTYLSAKLGTEIPMTDILTMQVWIPRYKYKVWNYNESGTTIAKIQPIEISFEQGTNSTGEIFCADKIQGENGDGTSETCKLKSTNTICTDETCNGKTYTHPGFTFGDEELTGFWIGKFEVSVKEDSDCYSNPSVANCDIKLDLFTKPDVISYGYAKISTLFNNVFRMNDNNNIYGFSPHDDTHMIKNNEWGAVAYLSRSKYGTVYDGKLTNVYKNNSSNHYTGRSGANLSSDATLLGDYVYNDIGNGTKASTTFNIYGVYDMVGGSWDATMTNIVSPDGLTMLSGYSTSNNSGFTGKVYAEGAYELFSGILYPDDKYYEKYSFGTTGADGAGIMRAKLGHGNKEALSNILPIAQYPWLLKGGSYNSTNIYLNGSGSFTGFSNSGIRTTRIIVVVS